MQNWDKRRLINEDEFSENEAWWGEKETEREKKTIMK